MISACLRRLIIEELFTLVVIIIVIFLFFNFTAVCLAKVKFLIQSNDSNDMTAGNVTCTITS